MKKQSDGRYRAKLTLGKDPSGKPIYKYISARTKKELEEKKRDAVKYYIEGDRSAGVMLFGTYALDWYNIRKKPFVSQGTRNNYSCVLNTHLLPTFGDRNISAITAMEVQAYINKLGEKYSAYRVDGIRNILVSIFECALQDGYVLRNPAKHMRIGGAPKKEKHVLTLEERARIEKVCATHPDGLLLALLYYTGMRGGEVRALRWKDVDLKSCTIHVNASLKQDKGTYVGPTKTPSSVRDVPIVAPLLALLQRGPIGMPETFVVHNKRNDAPILADNYRIRFGELMFAAGLAEVIPPEERDPNHRAIKYRPFITAHTLRHNMATMCWESGTIDAFSAAKLLGHASIKTTMDTYTHLSEEGARRTLGNLNQLFVAAKLPDQSTN